MKQMMFITECLKNDKGECGIICRLPNGQVINYADNVADFILWLDSQFTCFLTDKENEKDAAPFTDK